MGDGYFKEVSSVQKLSPTWMDAWVVEHSEWTVPELQLAKGADEDAVLYLFLYATQYQLTSRLSQACMQIQVTTRVSNDRRVLCGERLKDLKDKIGWDP